MTITTGDAQMVDPDPRDAFRLGKHRIRLDFSYFEGATAPNVPSALFEIFTVWKQNLSDVIFVDHGGYDIDLDDWPNQKTFKDRFSMIIVEARKRHIAVGFVLRTQTSFTQIKSLVRPLLTKQSAWIYRHTLAFTLLDIVPIGFLTNTNPRFHSSARLSEDVKELLIRNYEDLDSTIRDIFADEFYDYFDDDNELEPPPMIFAHPNLTSGNETAQAYEIQVERKNVSAAKYLLEAIYEITPEAQTTHKFVPYSFKHESQNIYRSVLRTQNTYLAAHRNIPLAGITVRQMHELVMWDQIEQTPHEVLSALTGVTRVDTTTRTHNLGKFNLSCTADSYVDIVKWLDTKLTSLFSDTTTDATLDDTPFPLPVRMSSGPARRRSPTNKPTLSAYAQYLRTSNMTDAETQAYIATCVSTEHAKLMTTTTQLSTDIGNMCQEFHNMIETTRTQQTA
jgi:hypothetical protein